MADWMRIILMGVGATIVLDLWSLAARKLLGISGLDYGLVGRWMAFFPRGRLTHDTIVQAKPMPGEKWLGWSAHYAIGVIFAWLFVALIDRAWLAEPRPEAAVLFGLVTVIVPFFVMQPALGFGVAASRTADPLSARLRSATSHAIFGLGLYLSALPLARLG